MTPVCGTDCLLVGWLKLEREKHTASWSGACIPGCLTQLVAALAQVIGAAMYYYCTLQELFSVSQPYCFAWNVL